MKPVLNAPIVASAVIVLLVLALTFDWFQSNSRYLYFTTELALITVCVALYVQCMKGVRWSDPPLKIHRLPRPHWKVQAKILISYLFALGIVLALVWMARGLELHEGFRTWLRSGMWYLYYVCIFGIFYFVTRRHLQYINFRAIIVTICTMLPVLVGYEAILLTQETGWKYNHSVIGWILDVPVDNILFVYPIAPALCIVLFTMMARYFNDLKAFWLIMAFLVPSSIVVELIGIYPPLELWDVFNDKSIWPMGRTNIEEFVYYVIFQLMSILLYTFFDHNFINGIRAREKQGSTDEKKQRS